MTSPEHSETTSAAAGDAALAGLLRELDRVFPIGTVARTSLAQPLAAVTTAADAAASDPAAAPVLAAALDAFEDVLEARLRAAGWPAGTFARGEAPP